MPRGQFPRQKGLKRHMPCRNIYERFFEKVSLEESDCWLWKGARAKAGYGTFNLGRRGEGYIASHVFTYEMLFGPVPDGKELDHRCRVTCCCNPWHLEAVPHLINFLRGRHPSALTIQTQTCKRGHAMEEANILRNSAGNQCRMCTRLRKRVAYKRAIAARLTRRPS